MMITAIAIIVAYLLGMWLGYQIEVEAEDEEDANWIAWEDISTSDLETDYVEIEEIEE